jgi:hypothetical protein
MYLTTATKKLQAFEQWEQHYCADVDKAYKMPDKKEKQQQQQPAGGQQQQQQPRQRVPPLRRPVEHPMWVNKRFTEVGLGLRAGLLYAAPLCFGEAWQCKATASKLFCLKHIAGMLQGASFYAVLWLQAGFLL